MAKENEDTLDELKQRIKDLEKEKKDAEKENETLLERITNNNERLVTLIQSQQKLSDKVEEDSETFEVKSLINVTMILQVNDPTGTRRVTFKFPQQNATHKLTKKQIREAYDSYPHLFDQGYLSTPVVEATDNVIEDYREYLEEMPTHGNAINAEIDKIDSPVVLYNLFNEIQNERYGEQIEGDDGIELEEKDIPVKWEKVERAVMKRLRSIGGAELRANE